MTLPENNQYKFCGFLLEGLPVEDGDRNVKYEWMYRKHNEQGILSVYLYLHVDGTYACECHAYGKHFASHWVETGKQAMLEVQDLIRVFRSSLDFCLDA